MSCHLMLLIAVFTTVELIYVCNGDSHSVSMNLGGCQGTPSSIMAAINASFDDSLTEIIPNCLQYSTDNTSISFGVFSYRGTNGSGGRYTLECTNGLLLLRMSTQSFSENITACYQCRDNDNPCVEGTECPPYCQLCLPSHCLLCTHARYNSSCLASAVCPNGGTPNASNGNECECRKNHGGPNCNDCLINESNCPSGQVFNSRDCSCENNCPSGLFRSLININATVPQSVVGSPRPGLDEHSFHCESSHRRKRASSPHGSSNTNTHSTSEPAVCVATCPNGWRPDSTVNGTCYACGITYCLECDLFNHCTKCRNGTLVNDSHCEGFYEVMYHLSQDLICEEREEVRHLDREKLELKIILPILCFFAVLVFIIFGIIAHFRYPHIGRDKRHRDPKKKVTTTEDTIEHKFRPQSTVMFR